MNYYHYSASHSNSTERLRASNYWKRLRRNSRQREEKLSTRYSRHLMERYPSIREHNAQQQRQHGQPPTPDPITSFARVSGHRHVNVIPRRLVMTVSAAPSTSAKFLFFLKNGIFHLYSAVSSGSPVSNKRTAGLWTLF